MVFHSMVLSCRKGSWFSDPWSFPAGKRHGFPIHGPFLQESVMVFHSMVLSCRKGSWFSNPRSFPAGKALSAVLQQQILGTTFEWRSGSLDGTTRRSLKKPLKSNLEREFRVPTRSEERRVGIECWIEDGAVRYEV